tara:strand:- start:164 stop:1048 length:885 start_codon:yes stop_codon:yes gene_type:complete
MNIKYVCLSGGAQYGISLIGALYEFEKKNIINFHDIRKVYGSSAGSIALAIWLLRLDKKDIYNFIINRPWYKTLKLENKLMSSLFNKKGFINKNFIIDILKPLLKTNSLDEDITLLDFYNYTNVEFHILATKLNTLEPIDFSHLTYPDVSLIDAIYMSSTIPCLMQPLYYKDSYILDAALSYNYPIKLCKDENPDETDNILGIKIVRNNIVDISDNTGLLTYINGIIERMRDKINKTNETDAKTQINIISNGWLSTNEFSINKCLLNKETRCKLLELGEKSVNEYLENSLKKLQ